MLGVSVTVIVKVAGRSFLTRLCAHVHVHERGGPTLQRLECMHAAVWLVAKSTFRSLALFRVRRHYVCHCRVSISSVISDYAGGGALFIIAKGDARSPFDSRLRFTQLRSYE